MNRALVSTFLALVGLIGCAAPLRSLDVSPALTTRADAVVAKINRATAAGDCTGAASFFDGEREQVRTCCAKYAPLAVKPLALFYDPLYPFGDGFVADGNLVTEQAKSGGGAGCGLPLWYHSGRFTVGSAVDRLAHAELIAEQATVTLDPKRRALSVVATVVIDPRGLAIVPIQLAGDPEDKNGVTVKRVLRDGAPYPWKQVPGTVLVPGAKRRLTLVIEYGGVFGESPLDYLDADELVLRSDMPWLPLLPDADASFDITVVHPTSFAIFGQGERLGPDRFRVEHAAGFTLLGGNHYVTRTAVVAGGPLVTLAVYCEDAAHLDELETELRALLAAYAPFGPYPSAQLAVVESRFGRGNAGFGALWNVTFGFMHFKEPSLDTRALLAHELAHAWFGNQVSASRDTTAEAPWQEALAEYAAALALSDQDGAALRSAWRKEFDALAPGEQRPLLHVGQATWPVRHVLAYDKGALAIMDVEQRCGRDKTMAALRRFVDGNGHQRATWQAIVAAVRSVCGDESATALASALRR